MHCITIWIQTGAGFEKETERMQTNWRFLKETESWDMREISPNTRKRMLAKRIGKVTSAGALGHRTTPPPGYFQQVPPTPVLPCLHSCILLACFPQLCCQVQIFPLPSPLLFLGLWKSKVLSICVSGLSHHLLSLGKLWRIWPS